jgi:hypothetical protein
MRYRTSRRAATAATITAGGIVLALSAGVSQAAAATTIDPLAASAPLVEKLYVPLSVTVTCDPPTDWWASFVGDVVIKQVIRGKQIAHGATALPSLTCDSVPHTYDIDVFPDAGTATVPPSAPFKKGDAVISVDVSNLYSSTDRASSGPQTIRLT